MGTDMIHDTAINLLQDTLDGFLSLLFPTRCAGCDRIDQPLLCDLCHSKLEWLDASGGCWRCGEPLELEETTYRRTCQKCREHLPKFTQAIAALRYSGPLARAIPLWKYRDQRGLSKVFGNLLCEWTASHAPAWWEKVESVVPVPHHPKTLRDRGFSPSDDLARHVAESFALPFLPKVVFKVRYTLPQNGLDQHTRMMNLQNSMKVFDPSLVANRVILVVDDVMTTGATLSECARALSEVGAGKIYGLVLARQSEINSYPVA